MVELHVNRSQSCQYSKLEAALSQLKTEHDTLLSTHVAVNARVEELNAALKAIEKAKEQLQWEARAAEGAAKKRIGELVRELEVLRTAHAGCNGEVSL